MEWFVTIVLWAICAILNYGLLVAYFQRRFWEVAHECRITDRVFAACVSVVFGPVALLATILARQYDRGWML